jgi:hypothetical protein
MTTDSSSNGLKNRPSPSPHWNELPSQKALSYPRAVVPAGLDVGLRPSMP